MTFDKTTLTKDIKTVLATAKASSSEADSSQDFAAGIADAIEAYVKTAFETATVTVVAPASAINVQGSAVSQTNIAPITIKGDPASKVALLRGGIS